jgi:hypothetical protein
MLLSKVMFGLFKSRKKGDVLNHWIEVAEGFSLSSQEFYDSLDQLVAQHKLPDLNCFRVEFNEGGIGSDKRIYMRIQRKQMAFDVCAAPHGADFFFSCRTVLVPFPIQPWHLLAATFILSLMHAFLSHWMGSFFAIIATVTFLFAMVQTFHNASEDNAAQVHDFLMKVPIIGPIYYNWFFVETYYRQDTRMMYMEIIPELVRRLASEATAAQGVKLRREYQFAPIFGDIYKPMDAYEPHNLK